MSRLTKNISIAFLLFCLVLQGTVAMLLVPAKPGNGPVAGSSGVSPAVLVNVDSSVASGGSVRTLAEQPHEESEKEKPSWELSAVETAFCETPEINSGAANFPAVEAAEYPSPISTHFRPPCFIA